MNFRRLAALSILPATLIFSAGQGWADAWQQTGSASISTEYDTNPAMSPAYPGGVWRYVFEPGYSLVGRLGESEVKAGLALQMARSSNETLSPNRDSPSAFLEWQRQTDAGEFGLASRYIEIATRDAGIDATGPVSVASTRTSRTLSGKWSKAVTERGTLSADGSYEGVSYAGGPYINYVTRSAGMKFSYASSERIKPLLKLSYADYEPADGGPTVQFTSAQLGFDWKVSDALEGSLQAGKFRTSDNNELGSLGGATVRYTGERNQLALSADRQVTPSGLGGFVTVDQANAGWSYALSERSRTGIDLGWRKNYYDTVFVNRTAGAWLQQDLDSFWGMRTYYLHNILSGDGVEDASSDILGITFVYTHTDF